MDHHESMTNLQGKKIVFLAIDINLPGAVDWVMVQSCFDFDFMLVLEKQENQDGHQQFFAIVQLIGTREQAKNFAYRLELNAYRWRLAWEATPWSIHEGIATAVMNSDCLVFVDASQVRSLEYGQEPATWWNRVWKSSSQKGFLRGAKSSSQPEEIGAAMPKENELKSISLQTQNSYLITSHFQISSVLISVEFLS